METDETSFVPAAYEAPLSWSYDTHRFTMEDDPDAWCGEVIQREYKEILSKYIDIGIGEESKIKDHDWKAMEGQYDVTFWCVADKTQWQFDNQVSKYHRCLQTGIMGIVAFVTCVDTDKSTTLFFSPPRVSKDRLFQPHAGWVDELAVLFDHARYIITFNELWTFGLLRKEFPIEQRMDPWRAKSRDVFEQVTKNIARQHTAVHDLLHESNGLNFQMPPWQAVSSQYKALSIKDGMNPMKYYMVLHIHVIHTVYRLSLESKKISVTVKSMAKKGPDVGKKSVKEIELNWLT